MKFYVYYLFGTHLNTYCFGVLYLILIVFMILMLSLLYYNKNKKKPFVVEFWDIEENISLKDYINKYCGVTIEVKGKNGNILKQIISPEPTLNTPSLSSL